MDPSSSSSGTLSNSEWLLCIREDLDRARQREQQFTTGEKVCIFRVPQYLRGGGREETAYIPHVVSIGPYHRNRQELHHMEVAKKRALYKRLERNEQDVKIYLDTIKEVEQRARGCYDKEINLGSNEFVLMMVLDGFFVIEIIEGYLLGFTELGYSEYDPIFTKKTVMKSIVRDMIMLENQIPFFILNRIWDLQYNRISEGGFLISCLRFFDHATLTYKGPRNESSTTINMAQREAYHFLDVCRRTFLSFFRTILISSEQLPKTTGYSHIPSVTELREAGVKFENHSEINFENGVLKLPQLLIEDRSKYFFMNLIAFEQCCFNGDDDITFYFSFMDGLIKTSKDVGHLKKHGIIKHWLGTDDEVAEIFHTMFKDVMLVNSHNHLSALTADVHRYCKQKSPRYLARLKGSYKRNPWKLISVPGLILLLLLTFLQTFYAIYSYESKPKCSPPPK